MPRFVRVAELQEIPEGQAKVFRVHDREIAIFHADGAIRAVKNSCPHQGAALDRGSVVDGTLTCPGHGSTVVDGQPTNARAGMITSSARMSRFISREPVSIFHLPR